MGRYDVGKGGEIAVVGVRTRARARAAMASALQSSSTSAAGNNNKKMKKVTNSKKTTPYDVRQLRTRRQSSRIPAHQETTSSSVFSEFPSSCCSSNDNDDGYLLKRSGVADPEAEIETTSKCEVATKTKTTAEERRNTSTSITTEKVESDDHVDSSTPKSTVQMISSTTMMPTNAEIDDFFAVAERDIHKRFSDKYNFDIVKDVPLEGRYEWVQINP